LPGSYGCTAVPCNLLCVYVTCDVCSYWVMANSDDAGLFTVPPTPHPYTTAIVTDLFLTCFFVVFFTALVQTPGIRQELIKGKVLPLSDQQLARSFFRFFPVRIKSTFGRSFLLALEMCLIYYGLTLLILSTACAAGGMADGAGGVCHIPKQSYQWFKGTWAMVLAMIAWPIGFLGVINKSTLPQDVYEIFAERERGESIVPDGSQALPYDETQP